MLVRCEPVREQPAPCNRSRDHGHQLLQDRILACECIGAAGGSPQIRQRDQDLRPAIRRRQRHLELGDHAVRAVGVVDLLDVGAAQLEDPRLGLHRHDPSHQDVAAIAQKAPGHRPDARAAAGDVAAERPRLVRAWMQPQLLAAIGGSGGVELGQFDSSLDMHTARPDLHDPGQLGQIEHHAAAQRHRLAVVASPTAAHGQGYAVPVTGRDRPDDLGLVAWRHDGIGRDVVELALQDRAVPVEIPATPADLLQLGLDRDPVQLAQHLLDGAHPVLRGRGVAHAASPRG